MKWWYLLLGFVPVPVGFKIDEWTDTVINATVVLSPASLVLFEVVTQSYAALSRLLNKKDVDPTEMQAYDPPGVHEDNGAGVCKQD
jgi:hypothetical protein